MAVPRAKLPLSFDPTRLRADLANVSPADWVGHFNQTDYEGEWSGVALRSAGGRSDLLHFDPSREDVSATPALLRCRYLQEVLAVFRCPLALVRLLKLAPGGRILEHSDPDLGYQAGTARIQIPITTNPGVRFFLDGTPVVMREGETWYLDLSLPHRARNDGDTDRVHLVIDCVVDDWLRSLIEEHGVDPTPARLSTSELPESEPSRRELERFGATVLADPLLQDRLLAAEDRDTFVSLVLELARERGCEFYAADLEEAMRAGRRAWIERMVR